MTVDDLNLVGAARAGALTLEARHPGVVFTSGRRDVAGQARAMASNVVGNRRWIVQTYTATPESQAVQNWVDRHPLAVDRADIAAGLESVMMGWTDTQKASLSKHFSGQAFDVQPMLDGGGKSTAQGAAVMATIRGLPGLTKFLDHEGGLVRWHAQFA